MLERSTTGNWSLGWLVDGTMPGTQSSWRAVPVVGEGEARHLVMVAPMRALEMVEEFFRAGPERRAEALATHDSELVDP